VPVDTPLSVFTVGSEVDGCGRTHFPDNIQPAVLEGLKPSRREGIITGLDPIETIGFLQTKLNSAINWVGCKLNPNDVIGTVNNIHDVKTAGGHNGYFSKPNKDFELWYRIDITKPEK
jgi:hypothetical protein